MSVHKRLFAMTFAVLLATGIVCWPTAASAAGPSDPSTGKEIRTERQAAPQTERTEVKLSPLALRLFGGYSQVEAGDVNKGLDGYFELFELYAAEGYGTVTGGYNPLRSGYNFGADLVFQLTRHVGIGIGAGRVRFSESSHIAWSYGPDYDFSSTPTLSAIPVRLALFLTIPLGRKLNLTIDAGAAAYAELKLEARQRFERSDGHWTEMSFNAARNTPFDNIGFQGSLGFEFMILPNTGFFVEALGRYARFENFAKATESLRNEEGDSETIEGRLYLKTYTFDGKGYSRFTVEATPPVSEPPHLVYTEPKVDLSGFSLQAGLRIRL